MTDRRSVCLVGTCSLVALLGAGCASTPEPIGFLSDYSRLEKTGSARMGYVSPQLRDYDAFMIDPVEYRITRDKPVLTDEQKAEIANYFRTRPVEPFPFDRRLERHTNRTGQKRHHL